VAFIRYGVCSYTKMRFYRQDMQNVLYKEGVKNLIQIFDGI